ncbi:hypothetical protein ABFA07_009426 [Porites harrisoni]
MENAAQRLIDHTRAQRNVGSARGEDTFRGQYSPGSEEPDHVPLHSSQRVNVTPIFDIPRTATSRGSSDSRSTLMTLPSSVSSGKDRDDIINEYFDETGLVKVIETWIKQLSHEVELPYNPYPALVQQARQHTEQYHMFEEDIGTIKEKLEGEVFSIGGYVFRTQDSPARWGLQTILRAINTESLTQYDWLLSSMNTEVSNDDAEDYSYVVQKPFPILVGPCIFAGSLYPLGEEDSINIRMEYSINGPQENYACELFAKAVWNDIQMMQEAEVHILLGVTVPVEDVHHRGNWAKEFWTSSSIDEIQDQFLILLRSAAAAQKILEAQCMFKLQPESRLYRRGHKQYHLIFLKTEEGRSTCRSSVPYQSAHEGVFVSRFHIKEYFSWFSSLELGTQQISVTPTNATRGGRSRRKRDTSSRQPQPRTVSRISNQTSSTAHGDMDSSTRGPYSEDILDSVRAHFREQIFELGEKMNFMKMIHYVILLVLLNKEDADEQTACLVEAYRLLRSTAYQLHLVMQQNIVIQDLITFFSSRELGASDVVQAHFLAYRHSLKNFFSNCLREKSSDLLYHGQVLIKMLDSMTVINPYLRGKTRTGTLPLTAEVSKALEVVNRYCETIFLGLLDDALFQCSCLKKYFPSVRNSNSFIVQQRFKHGAERLDIINQGNLVLDVVAQAKTIAAPSAITKETVLLQYFVDSKLDQVFHEFLVDLVTDEEFIPPNPYPRLTTHLTVAAIRMELFGEKRTKLLSKLVSGSVQSIDSQSFVSHIPGIEAYGLVSAIATLDGKQYNYLRSKLHILVNKVNTRLTISGFKTIVDAALSGFGPLYGRMMPYLHEVELEEHYFIQGPRVARSEAIVHFAKLVYDHLMELSEKEGVLFLGIFLGGESLRRSLHDIVAPQRKKAFLTQIIATVTSKQLLYLRVYVTLDWRLVMVKKSFLLHFWQQDREYERFYIAGSDPLALYRSVFSNQEVALLYISFCGPQDDTDPCKGENLALSLVHVDHYIERAKEEESLLSVYRWLLVKSLISQHQSYLVDVWYMLNSVAFELEYLTTLNKTLQNLVNEELSRSFRPVLEDDDRTSLLDASVLSTIVTAYTDKIERVLNRGTSLAPSALLLRLRGKLRLVTSTNPVSRSLTLSISSKTPFILQEINELLHPLMNAAAHNVHMACPEIHRALKSVEVDVSGRKSSMQEKLN